MEIFAPFAGIVHYRVRTGDPVTTGDILATVEAIKLEAAVAAPGPGIVGKLACEDFTDVSGGDMLLTLDENTKKAEEA